MISYLYTYSRSVNQKMPNPNLQHNSQETYFGQVCNGRPHISLITAVFYVIMWLFWAQASAAFMIVQSFPYVQPFHDAFSLTFSVE